MKAQIAVATTSFIRNTQEEKIVLESIYLLSKLAIPVVITDGGSPPYVVEKITRFPNITLLKGTSLSTQLIKSLLTAAEK